MKKKMARDERNKVGEYVTASFATWQTMCIHISAGGSDCGGLNITCYTTRLAKLSI